MTILDRCFSKKNISVLFLLFFVFVYSILPIYGNSISLTPINFNDQLTSEEEAYLNSAESITVALPQDWPPFQFRQNDEPVGLSVDYINAISKILGDKIKILYTDWDSAFYMLENHEVDLIMDISKTESRTEYMLFSDVYAQVLRQFAVRSDSNISNAEDLNYSKVGVIKDSTSVEDISSFFDINGFTNSEVVIYPTSFKALNALVNGEIDAYYDISAAIDYSAKLTLSSNIKQIHIPNVQRNVIGLRVGIRDDQPILRDIINKAMNSIPIDETNRIQEKWINGMQFFSFHSQLSKIEKDWLNKHSSLTLDYNSFSSYSPLLQYIQPSVVDNIAKDYLKLIATRIGCNTSFDERSVYPISSAETISVYSNAINYEAYDKELLFTNSYFDSNLVIFGLIESVYISDLNQLNDKKVVVVKNSPVASWLSNNYPAIRIISTDSVESALMLVSQHDADAFIDTLMNGSLSIASSGTSNIKIIGETKYEYNYRFAVPSNHAILTSILNKAIDSISPEEQQEIVSRWVNINYTHNYDSKYLYVFGSASIFIICLLLFRNLLLTKVKKDVEANMAVIDKYVLCFKFDQFGKLSYVSQALCDFIGFSNLEFMNMNAYDIVLEDKLIYAIHKLKSDPEWEGNLLINNSSNTTLVCKANISVQKDKPHAIEYTAFLYNITDSTKEIIQKEMAFLRAQIKPHFLFNTLNTILYFWKFETEKAGDLLENFSKFLRSGFDFSDENIHVKKELEYIYSYLAIEQARFDKLSVIYDFDENELDFSIPPFLIQPLIENAIKHGILPKREGGTVTLSIKKEMDHVLVIIADDGVGMSKEKLHNLLEGKIIANISKRKQDKHASIGFNNVRKRIQNYYGYTINIDSEVNNGTKVTITIPHN